MSREMKYSGAAWIGDIPINWNIIRIKYCAKLYNGNSLNEQQKTHYSSVSTHPTIPYISTKDIERDIEKIHYNSGINIPIGEKGFLVAPQNSTLVCIEGGSAGKKVGFTNRDICFVNKLCCINASINNRYVYYYVLSHAFNEPFTRNMQGLIGGVSISVLQNFPITIPSLEEQKLIVQFLDKKCNVIDELVALQEKMIEELKAYKQSVITEAVCKGLNPNVPMKDSGVDWIDVTPEHWEVRAIKTMALLKSGDNLTSLDIDENVTLYPVYGGNGVRGYYSQYNHDGDYALIGRQGALCGNVNYGYGRFWATEHCVVCHPKCNYILKWFGESLRAMNLNQYSLSSAQPGISVDRINNVKMLVPPIQEQQSIADYLDKKCSEIDQLIAIKQKKIEALNDYKKSLIYEYTTGKKEVKL